ncbi:ester cyclase [Mucilaginibacter terrenus]|uniref:Ester cyclase n=1 Tax=Mucilaginibacter terrenus TaxID=2482727 RepID=A0A3E2NR87_9SPHI|nr:ester cyclase [Mucilaginibacter terrenus]RFZ83493.1 ester cyclase [Mucilaginibacter terrenus]
METTEKNKHVVLRFNKEVIEQGNQESFNELMHQKFINQSAPEGMDNGAQGMSYFFEQILRPALPDVKVTIHQQVAEGDLVTTRKTITGTHTGTLLDVEPTGRLVQIDVIDIVEVKDGKYLQHWGITSLPAVLSQLKQN